jgi:ribosomal protein S3
MEDAFDDVAEVAAAEHEGLRADVAEALPEADADAGGAGAEVRVAPRLDAEEVVGRNARNKRRAEKLVSKWLWSTSCVS